MRREKHRWLAVAALVIGSCNPVIRELEPASGPNGSAVWIRGSGLAPLQGVRFDGVPATFDAMQSDAQNVLAYVPNSAKTGPVEVDADGRTATSPYDFAVTKPVQEQEPNDTLAEATRLVLPAIRGVGSVNGADVDWFELDVGIADRFGTTYEITVAADETFPPTPILHVAVYHKNGMLIAESIGSRVSLWVTKTAGQSPFVRVSLDASTPTASALYSVDAAVWPLDDPFEPNDAMADAKSIPLPNTNGIGGRWTFLDHFACAAQGGGGNSLGYVDHYRFGAPDNDAYFVLVFLSFRGSANMAEPITLELRDAAGTLVLSRTDYGSNSFNYDVQPGDDLSGEWTATTILPPTSSGVGLAHGRFKLPAVLTVMVAP